MQTTAEMMIRMLRENFELKILAPDSKIEDLEIDSLDLINFLFSLNEKTGVDVPDDILAGGDMKTISDLADYIDKNKGGG